MLFKERAASDAAAAAAVSLNIWLPISGGLLWSVQQPENLLSLCVLFAWEVSLRYLLGYTYILERGVKDEENTWNIRLSLSGRESRKFLDQIIIKQRQQTDE